MLQTDEIEEDYFTPASSTTLANIFGKKTDDQKTENESLKYTPPKPQNVAPKPEESKATNCVFACALYGYEWYKNANISRGKLGFAIIKVIKSGYHNIVLYDSNKTTLSCATVSPTLEIIVKSNVYLSYFDNMQKYWSLYSTEEEVTKIIENLKILNPLIKYLSNTDKELPIPIKQGIVSKPQPSEETKPKIGRESDTDSSEKQRTKLSILSRMANVGHSVLPSTTLAIERASDSSDTNDSLNYSKTVTRHKVVKGSNKRNNADKSIDIQSLVEANKISRAEPNIEHTPPLYTYVGSQIVPVTTSSIMLTSSNTASDMNIFMSEQRINNSEIRINMTRMTDKVDQVLEKISDLTHKNTSNVPNSFQNEILQKLLNEYETKIKMYEDIIKTKGVDKLEIVSMSQESEKLKSSNEVESLNQKLSEVKESNRDKDNQILILQSELQVFKEKNKIMIELEKNNSNLLQENQGLKLELEHKNKEIEAETEKLKSALAEKCDNDNRECDKDIIKKVLNDTFHAISANFESNENYRGESIKNIVANVIRRAFENLKDQD